MGNVAINSRLVSGFSVEQPVMRLPSNSAAITVAVTQSPPTRLHLDRLATPIGVALLVCDQAGVLRALDFYDYETRMRRLLQLHYGSMPLSTGAAPAELKQLLQRYFDGELSAVRSIVWATGGTAFQRSVWRALTQIPAGQTRTYGELAQSLQKPGAARAVGLANGANPVAIVAPCHRVIGASGKLTGYAGGLQRKQWLLRHEGVAI